MYLMILSLLATSVVAMPKFGQMCGKCDTSKCILPKHCKGGSVLDSCGCCKVCTRGEGEVCGGLSSADGICKKGLTCLVREPKSISNRVLPLFAKVGRCEPDVCTVGGKKFKIGERWVDENCTGLCKCDGRKGFGCVSLCPPEGILCPIGQIVKYVDEPLSWEPRCSCPRPKCVDAFCTISGKKFKAEERFIHPNCGDVCQCHVSAAGHGISCHPLCGLIFVECSYGQIKRYFDEPVRGSNCSCSRAKCVNDEKTCTLDFEAGPCAPNSGKWFFNPKFGQCELFGNRGCNSNDNSFDTKQNCEKLCLESKKLVLPVPPEPKVVITEPEVVITEPKVMPPGFVPEEVMPSNTEAPLPRETNKTQEPEIGPPAALLPVVAAFCTISGKKFKVGKQFIHPNCGGVCQCHVSAAGHGISCVSLCPPVGVRCPYGQIERYFDEPVQGSNCSCSRPKCVNDEKTCTFDFEAGPCTPNSGKWFFNPKSGQCELFGNRGCNWNDNSFDTKQNCETFCLESRKLVLPEPPEVIPSNTEAPLPRETNTTQEPEIGPPAALPSVVTAESKKSPVMPEKPPMEEEKSPMKPKEPWTWPEGGPTEEIKMSDKNMTIHGTIKFTKLPAKFPKPSCLRIRVEDHSVADVSAFLYTETIMDVSNITVADKPIVYSIVTKMLAKDELWRFVSVAAVLNVGWCRTKGSPDWPWLRNRDYVTDTGHSIRLMETKYDYPLDINMVYYYR